MAHPIDDDLIVIASSALFDLSESNEVFLRDGEERYRTYQRQRENEVLPQGVAFPFIKRMLDLNHPAENDEPVEVVLLSRNNPDTGLRVMNSIEHYGLPISRAAVVRGNDT